MKPKKIPLRKCIGCNEMKDKRELIRVVKDEQGGFSLDLTGKKNGRGAYVCHNGACVEKARKSKGFERAFKAAVPAEVYEELKKGLAEGNGLQG